MRELSGNPASHDLNWQISRAVSKALHSVRKHKSRAQVAEELSARTGRQISVAILNEFTRDGTASSEGGKRPKPFPAALVAPFCEVTGDDSLLQAVAGAETPAEVRNRLNKELRRARKALGEIDVLVNRVARPKRTKVSR